MALRAASTVSPGDTATATQYNNSLRDAIYLGGDHATSGGSANVQTLSVSAQVTTYETGMKIRFIAGFTNTSSMTLNVNSIGAKTVKDELGNVLTGGEVVANSPVEMVYNGTDLILRKLEISGIIKIWPMRTAPSGYLLCDGTAVSRTTYAILFNLLNPTLGTFTVTIASPGLVTLTSHGRFTGDSVYLTTSGALPTGLSANTRYWIIKNDANSFWLATSLANARAGTKINTSGSQSGTHTATDTPYGLGDGSTTFNLPDYRQNVPVGLDTTSSEFLALGQVYGEKTHLLTGAESGLKAHAHDFQFATGSGSAFAGIFSATGGTTTTSNAGTASKPNTVTTEAAADASSAHNNIQLSLPTNYIIKT